SYKVGNVFRSLQGRSPFFRSKLLPRVSDSNILAQLYELVNSFFKISFEKLFFYAVVCRRSQRRVL
ncbi:MAG: hypothetical protein Q4F51_02895, partial [Sarcina sp.]|nr:hypothetical protein [Sarcina sp.]